MLERQPLTDRSELGLCLLERRIGVKAPDGLHEVCIARAARQVPALPLPDVDVIAWEVEVGGHHSRDGVGIPVEGDLAPYDGGVGVIAGSP